MHDYTIVSFFSDSFAAEDTSKVQVRRLDGHEAIGELFEFEIHIATSKEIDEATRADMLAQPARLRFDRVVSAAKPHELIRRIRGIVVEIRDRMTSEANQWEYVLRMVPAAWRCTLTKTNDVFMDMTLEEIIRAKLTFANLKTEQISFALDHNKDKREFVVQYQETDWSFIKRLCEHAGVYFYFKHDDKHGDVIHFQDNQNHFPALATEHFHKRGEQVGVFALERVQRAITKEHRQRDYNHRKPTLDVKGTEDLSGGPGLGGLWYEYGAHVKDETQAKSLAQIRAQEVAWQQHTYEGESELAVLSAGRTIDIEDSPVDKCELTLVEVRHLTVQAAFGEGGSTKKIEEQSYQNSFVAIPKGTEFRTPRRTPKPVVPAVITGQTKSVTKQLGALDDEGNYHVEFHFDAIGRGDKARASRPIRMAQPCAGDTRKFHLPLKAETEVLISCVNGDPDRPIIIGAVPNAQSPSPVNTANKEKLALVTNHSSMFIDDQDPRLRFDVDSSKNVLQLGKPSPDEGTARGAPEVGIALATTDNLTNTVEGTLSSVSSTCTSIQNFGTNLNTETKLSWVGDIEPWSGWQKVEVITSALAALAKSVEAGVTTFQDARTKGLERAKSQAAARYAAAHKKAFDDLKKKLPKPYPAGAKKKINADGTVAPSETEDQFMQRKLGELKPQEATKLAGLEAEAKLAAAEADADAKKWKANPVRVWGALGKSAVETADKIVKFGKDFKEKWSTISDTIMKVRNVEKYEMMSVAHWFSSIWAKASHERRAAEVGEYASVISLPPQPTHIIGSNHSVGVYGKKNAVMYGDRQAVVCSIQDAHLLAGEAAHVKAVSCVELAAHKVKASGGVLVDLHAKKKVAIVAHSGNTTIGDKTPTANHGMPAGIPDPPPVVVPIEDIASWWKIESKDDVSMVLLAEKGIKMQAEKEQIEVKAKKHIKFESETKNFEVKAKEEIKLEAEDKRIFAKAKKKGIHLEGETTFKALANTEALTLEAKAAGLVTKAAKSFKTTAGTTIDMTASANVMIKGAKILLM